MAQSVSYVMQLDVKDMARNTGLQSWCWEPVTQKFYVSQAIGSGPRDMEHTYIRKFDNTGRYEGFMKLNDWGHGNQIGLRRSAEGNIWIWAPLDSYNKAGSTTRTRPSRIVYTAGATKYPGSSNVDIYSSSMGSNGFGLEYPWLFLRQGHAGYETYLKVNEDEYRSRGGNATVRGRVNITRSGKGRYFQGCGAIGNWVGILTGSTNKTNFVRIFDMTTDKLVQEFVLTRDKLVKALRGRVTATSSIEPEGLFWVGGELYMGARCGPPGGRRDFPLLKLSW